MSGRRFTRWVLPLLMLGVLLLLLLLSAFIAACARILKGGFSWLR